MFSGTRQESGTISSVRRAERPSSKTMVPRYLGLTTLGGRRPPLGTMVPRYQGRTNRDTQSPHAGNKVYPAPVSAVVTSQVSSLYRKES